MNNQSDWQGYERQKKFNEAKSITYFSTDLVSTLASLHVNYLAHFYSVLRPISAVRTFEVGAFVLAHRS